MARSNFSASRRLVVAAVALFVLLGLGIDWWKRRAAPARAAAVRLTSGGNLHTEPAISPDGKLVAYASDRGGGTLQVWVQPSRGGEPRRVTNCAADCRSPAFSPDGAALAWREEGAPGAIWTGPLAGGAPRRIAEGGRDPAWSPDGKWLAWWVRRAAGRDEMWAARTDGSEPRRVCPQCESARYPVWAPDSRRLVFLSREERRDWYAAGLDGGPAAATGAYSILNIQMLGGELIPTAWNRDAILFTGPVRREVHVWRMPISPATLQCAEGARRLTSGGGIEGHASAASGGAVVYASESLRGTVWEMALDAGRVAPAGEPRRLAEADLAYPQFSLSADGRRLALRRENEFRILDQAGGAEIALPVREPGPGWPVISPDGSRVAYYGRGAIHIVAAAGGESERMGGGARDPLAWSRDGGRILCHGRSRGVFLMDASNPPRARRSREQDDILRHPEDPVDGPQFSPDGRWIALYTRRNETRRVWIVPFREGSRPGDDQWIAVTEEDGDSRNPMWAAEGNLLYYLSGRDGYRCIWAQPLDAAKRARGAPVAVRHFHSARRSLTNPRNPSAAGFAFAAGKLVFTQFETGGDIWMLPPEK